MKQAAKIQRQMEQKQAELAERVIEASSGGGAVTVSITCDCSKVTSIKINPESVDASDIEMLEDLVVTAMNAAMEKAKQISNDEMGELTSGMSLPGLI
jgi:hypothetical protein